MTGSPIEANAIQLGLAFIAIGSLLISIYSLRLSRRALAVNETPVVSTSLKIAFATQKSYFADNETVLYATQFAGQIHNHHPTYNLIDIQLSIGIWLNRSILGLGYSRPIKFLGSENLIGSLEIPVLESGELYSAYFRKIRPNPNSPDTILETVLAEEPFNLAKSQIDDNKRVIQYDLLFPKTLTIIHRVSYKPAVHGSRRVNLIHVYKITPETIVSKTSTQTLVSWSLKQIR